MMALCAKYKFKLCLTHSDVNHVQAELFKGKWL